VPLAGLLVIWAIWVAIAGGIYFEWHGWRFSSRNPSRPLLGAVFILAVAWWRYGRGGVQRDLEAWRTDVGPFATPFVLALSIVVLVLGVVWSTKVAGGADAYGYVSQSDLWAKGQLQVVQPIAAKVPWPLADWTFAPLGYKPAPGGGAIVPTYSPGLPMLMALFSFVSANAIYWVVPLAGSMLIVLSFLLGRALGGPAAGLLTAALVATSPTFLFQVMWPMSDIVVATFWVAALVLAIQNRPRTWLGAGLASASAIVTRPNTVPIAAVLFLGAVWLARSTPSERKRWLLAPALYAAGIVPGILAVVAIHTAWYGSPFESGYGPARELYFLANGWTNVARYLRWLISSETPFVALILAAPVIAWRSGQARSIAVLTTACAAATWLCYMFYRPFNDWWYLRFLLPAIPCLLAIAATVWMRLVTALPGWLQVSVAFLALAPVFAWRIDYAISHGAFGVWKLERRYVETGRYVASRLPSNAVFICMQQSGSLRYYSGRLTIRWDYLEPAWLDRTTEILKGLSLEPYILLEEQEEPDFRGRFAGESRLGRLNWSPRVTLDTVPVVRIYDPDDAPK
jgi:Dolichyl-phosphate-mannose-protein mannosyltransferase